MHARSGAMADRIWDHAVPQTTASIFDDAVYFSEALGLPVTHTEDDLDADLALQARESGIHDPYRFLPPPPSVSRAMSTMTLDSDQASARSMRSQETHSTSFTSAPSRTSRDHVYSTDHPSAKRAPPTLSHASQSVEHAHQPIERPDSGMQSRKSSALSSTSSVVSSTSSSQQTQSRKKRGSAIFSKLRRESRNFATVGLHSRVAKSCNGNYLSAAYVASQSRTQVAKVECSHAESAGPRSASGAEEVTGFVAEGTVQASDVSLQRNPGSRKPGVLPSEPLPSAKSPLVSEASSTVSNAAARRSTHEPISMDSALAKAAFKSFKTQQREQWERVSAFECMQRKALASHYESELKQLRTQYEARKSERTKQHADDLDRLEERQLLAEHDLLQTQAQETQNVATALKYIEAYCLGTKSQHERTVSEEDLKKLERQRLLQQDLPRKHASAINVLRARQEMDFKRRVESQEAELKQMDADFEKEEATKEAEYKKELEQLEALIESRRRRLLQRWDLKFEMWRRDWEQQHNTTLDEHLEHEDWPPRKADNVAIIPESSALAQYVKITA